MMYSLVDGEKVEAKKGLQGTCVCCGSVTIPKCGTIKIHHWAHRSLTNCDSWWENEGPWHRDWKRAVGAEDPARIEITIKDHESGKWHRADAMTPDGWVVELQHSPISHSDMDARESFYGQHAKGMIWIFDHYNKVYLRDHRLEDAKAIVFVHDKKGVTLLVKHPGEYRKREIRLFAQEELVEILSTKGMSAILQIIEEDKELRIQQEAIRVEEAKKRQLEWEKKWKEEQEAKQEAQKLRWVSAIEEQEARRVANSHAAYLARNKRNAPPPVEEDSVFGIFAINDEDNIWNEYVAPDDLGDYDDEDIGIMARDAAERAK